MTEIVEVCAPSTHIVGKNAFVSVAINWEHPKVNMLARTAVTIGVE